MMQFHFLLYFVLSWSVQVCFAGELELEPGGCLGVRLDDASVPERAVYAVRSESKLVESEAPVDTSLKCSSNAVMRSLPQDEADYARAYFTRGDSSECRLAYEGGTTSHSDIVEIQLNFQYLRELQAVQPKYTVCTDTTWREGTIGPPFREEEGPIPTFVFFYNPCETASAIVSYNISKTEASAEVYCDGVEYQSSSETRAAILLFITTVATYVGCFAVCCLCTRWCACLGAGWIRCALCCCVNCGMQRLTDVSRYLDLYSRGLSRPLLFWPMLAALVNTYGSVFRPLDNRPDVLNPLFGSTAGFEVSAFRELVGNGVGVLVTSLIAAMSYTTPIVCFLLVAYSNPALDPTFRTKRWIAAGALLLFNASIISAIVDQWVYVDKWDDFARSIWIQATPIICVIMTNYSFLAFWLRSNRMLRADIGVPPTTLVDITPSHSMRMNDSANKHIANAPVAGARNGMDDSYRPELSSAETPEALKGVEAGGVDRAGADAMAAAPQAEPACVVTATVVRARLWPRAIWDEVKEEPDFRYSVFVLVALLVAFLTLSSSFCFALGWVSRTGRCLKRSSTCVRDAEQWVIKTFARNFYGVDIGTLKVTQQLPALLNNATTLLNDAQGVVGNTTVAGLNWTANADAISQQLSSLMGAWDTDLMTALDQANSSQPKWIEDARIPVLVGGRVGFTLSYMLGLYTIYYCAASFKRITLLMRQQRSSVQGAQAWTAVEDMDKHAYIAQSIFFVGILSSTCNVQLWLSGLFMSVVLGALLHPDFWSEIVKPYWVWIATSALIAVFHKLSRTFLNYFPTDGKRIKRPIAWLFCYLVFSTVWMVVGLLLALYRLILLGIVSIFSLSRLDENLLRSLASYDNGYRAFLGMSLMINSLSSRAADTQAATLSMQAKGSSDNDRAQDVPAQRDSAQNAMTVPEAPAMIAGGIGNAAASKV